MPGAIAPLPVQLRVNIGGDIRNRLEAAARAQRRSLASTARLALEAGLPAVEAESPPLARDADAAA